MNSILPVFRRSLRESWRTLIGWSIGLAGVLFLYLRGGSGVYYLFGDGSGADALIDAGADLVQGYTAFIYEGPGWPGRVTRGMRSG